MRNSKRKGIVKTIPNCQNNSKKRTEEPSRHMEEIWREHHDPDTRIRRVAKFKKEKRLEDYKYDLGL